MTKVKRWLLITVAVAAGAVLLSGCLGAGTYVMGPAPAPGDYQAGLWHTKGGDGCYWARLSGFGGSLDEIIANDFSTGGPRYVQVDPTDAGFETSGCDPWFRYGVDAEPGPQAIPGQPFGRGDYKIGYEVAPGRYQSAGPTEPGGYCYWARLRGFHGILDDIITNNIGQGAMVVDIGASDAGFTSDGCQPWVKVG